mgnify:CR=1 FL=1
MSELLKCNTYKLILLMTFGLSSFCLFAGDWVKSFGSKAGNTFVTGVVTDSKGNALITGTFSSESLQLDASNTLSNNGMSDVFIVKYDTLGAISWKVSFGGNKAEQVSDICIDRDDNIYLLGTFTSSSFKIDDETITTSWPNNVYIAKFNSAGAFQWLRHSEEITNYVWAGGINCSVNQEVVFSGYFSGDKLTFGDFQLTLNAGGNKGFYGTMNSEGVFLSAGLIGDETEDTWRLMDADMDAEGNIYLAGTKTIHTEPDPVTWIEYRDVMYFGKWDAEGKLVWETEDTTYYSANKIKIRNDSLFLMGNREEWRIIFNGGTIDTTSRFYYGLFDLDGGLHWEQKYTGALAYDFAVSGDSLRLVGGLLLDHLDLGAYEIQRNADSSSICPIYQDIFMLTVDLTGDLQTVMSISGALEEFPSAVAMSSDGSAWYAGSYESYSIEVEGEEIINPGELSTFQHVSGIYYDRSIFSFVARDAGLGGSTGIPDKPVSRLKIYPNPTAGMVHIDASAFRGEARVTIYDLNGRIARQEKSNDSNITIDLSSLPGGLYLVTVADDESIFREPLVLDK